MIDIILGVLIIIGAIKGFSKGLILSVFTFVSYIIGLLAAMKFSTVVAAYLGDNSSVAKSVLPLLSFVLVFLLAVLLVRLGARFIEKVVQLALLGWINRLGGILLYVAWYLIFISVIVFYAGNIGIIKPETLAGSVLWPYIQPWGPYVINNIGKILPVFQDMFSELKEFFNGLHDSGS
ncbi:CvpA family protein [Polluticaenibacter yanchengensis]|uniref:CvpA family protein n=1 Tax=Polluticaenibacter yanchengensis TaxID=3014562 RepID=A0ABT4UJ56_9BACT|nr:CvpA family protein [Chitinophagaceae bacterium LY-5]